MCPHVPSKSWSKVSHSGRKETCTNAYPMKVRPLVHTTDCNAAASPHKLHGSPCFDNGTPLRHRLLLPLPELSLVWHAEMAEGANESIRATLGVKKGARLAVAGRVPSRTNAGQRCGAWCWPRRWWRRRVHGTKSQSWAGHLAPRHDALRRWRAARMSLVERQTVDLALKRGNVVGQTHNNHQLVCEGNRIPRRRAVKRASGNLGA